MSALSPLRESLALMDESYPGLADLTGLFILTLRKVARGKGTACGTLCLCAAALECPLGPLIAYQLPAKDRPTISYLDAPLPRDLPTAWEQIHKVRAERGIRYDDLPASSETSSRIQKGRPVRVATMAKYARALDLDLSKLVAAHGLPAVIQRGL